MAKWIFSLLICLGGCQHAFSADELCTGHYRGQKLDRMQLFQAYQQNKNLCGTDLEGADLSGLDLTAINLAGANLTNATLKDTNLTRANLTQAYFRWANATGATLQNANLMHATLSDANFNQSNLRLAQLQAATADHASFIDADCRHANFNQAELSQADFRNANLTDSSLVKAKLIGTRFNNAQLAHANLNQAIFEPPIDALPKLVGLTMSRNFRQIQINSQAGVAALINLRIAYTKIGLRQMERELTAMVKTYQMQMNWQKGGFDRIDAAVSYLLFYLPVDFGAAPGRALKILLLLSCLLLIPYRLALSPRISRMGIAIEWERKNTSHLRVPTHLKQTCSQRLKQKATSCWHSACFEQLRLLKIAISFSLLSAFSVVWRIFKIDTWISHVQNRDWHYRGLGWIQPIAGSQAILGAYLLVMWTLTYFGRPFEW